MKSPKIGIIKNSFYVKKTERTDDDLISSKCYNNNNYLFYLFDGIIKAFRYIKLLVDDPPISSTFY